MMQTSRRIAATAFTLVLAAPAVGLGQTGSAAASSQPKPLVPGQPLLIDGQLAFPSDPNAGPIPRFLTENERRYLEVHPLVAGQNDIDGGGMLRGPFASPTGTVRCPGEYEPTEGIVVAWKSFTTLLAQMGDLITNEGEATLYVACDSTAVRNSAQSLLTSAGANMSRVQFIITGTNTVWMRDYGPRYIYEGNVRAIIDHTYNRPRPQDDVFPATFGTLKNHGRYALPLIHGGGNYHLNGIGNSWATRLINNENPTLTEAQIIAYWNQFQNVNTTLTQPFPTSVDLTQHIDMWMQITSDNSAVIADWPNNVGSTQDMICDSTAAAMIGGGWTIDRVPGRSLGDHYTYTNVVMCNDIVIIPSYTNTTIVNAGHNAQALATWQSHMPEKQIFQLNCQAIVTSAGVMHCIVMHVPKHLGEAGPNGGLAPTAYLRSPRGGESLNPGENFSIRWLTDDEVAVSNVDILLSTDGGMTYPDTIAAATAPDGTLTWTVPDVYTQQARIRVVARDGVGNTGFDESPADFAINGTPPPCGADFDGNGEAEVSDIFAFLSAWFAQEAAADVDGIPGIDVPDIFFFLSVWFAGC